MTKNKSPKPPKHLHARGRAEWRTVVSSIDFEELDVSLLTAMCVQVDRAESAREQISKEGMTVTDRFGQVKPHPAVEIERQAHLAYVRIRREMAIDDIPPDSRPPLPRGYR